MVGIEEVACWALSLVCHTLRGRGISRPACDSLLDNVKPRLPGPHIETRGEWECSHISVMPICKAKDQRSYILNHKTHQTHGDIHSSIPIFTIVHVVVMTVRPLIVTQNFQKYPTTADKPGIRIN